ncbi:MAG: hypothetical protein EPN88_04660 [Bacteroidetes bacterium]|nr:MAG: hypothetical protein EPN88_04660 [Bacteroidota bacterium]
MTCIEKWNLAVNIIVALGTVGAVIVALFGDRIKNLIFRSKLSAEVVDPRGELTNWGDGRRVIYYHLKILNSKPSIMVNKCRVSLKEIYKRNNNSQFIKLQLVVPPDFKWAPAETSLPAINFFSEQILDFGFITEGSDNFSPSISPIWNNFKGYLKANETFRYVLEILSNNSKPKIITIEVSWDGGWDANLEIMGTAFKIRIL